MRIAVGFAVVVGLGFLCPAMVGAQDRPSGDEDRELDRVLRREYGDPDGPPPPPRAQHRLRPTLPPAPPPPPPPPPRRTTPADEYDEFFLNLGVLASHWHCMLGSASVSGARNGVHGDYVDVRR